MASVVFGMERPIRLHLVRSHGTAKEMMDLRSDADRAFTRVEGALVGTTAPLPALTLPFNPAHWVGSPPTSIIEAINRIAAALGPIA